MTGENLREIRIAAGIKLSEFAAETGFSESYLSLVEQGKRPFPQEHAQTWVRAICNIRERMARAYYRAMDAVGEEAVA